MVMKVKGDKTHISTKFKIGKKRLSQKVFRDVIPKPAVEDVDDL